VVTDDRSKRAYDPDSDEERVVVMSESNPGATAGMDGAASDRANEEPGDEVTATITATPVSIQDIAEEVRDLMLTEKPPAPEVQSASLDRWRQTERRCGRWLLVVPLLLLALAGFVAWLATAKGKDSTNKRGGQDWTDGKVDSDDHVCYFAISLSIAYLSC
jgi:hypothetical protein